MDSRIAKLDKIYQNSIARGVASFYSGAEFDYYMLGGIHQGCGCSGGTHGATFYRFNKNGIPINPNNSEINVDLTGFELVYYNSLNDIISKLSTSI